MRDSPNLMRIQCSDIYHIFEQRPLRKTRRGVRFPYFLFLRAGPLTSLTPSAWCGVCLPGHPGWWRTGRGNGKAPHQLRMRSDVVLRKQLCFLQRLQRPTPCLPRHIFAAEGDTAGNGSFPDVIGILPTAFSRRHRGVGSGRAGWEVMQLWTKALGSQQKEVRWGPRVPSWPNFHLHLTAMETSSPQSKGYGESRSRERDEQGRQRAMQGRLKSSFLLSCYPLHRKGRKPLFC